MFHFPNSGGDSSESNRHTPTIDARDSIWDGRCVCNEKTILLTFVFAVFIFWMESGIVVPARLTPGDVSEIMTVNNQAGFVENLTPGFVRYLISTRSRMQGHVSERSEGGANS